MPKPSFGRRTETFNLEGQSYTVGDLLMESLFAIQDAMGDLKPNPEHEGDWPPEPGTGEYAMGLNRLMFTRAGLPLVLAEMLVGGTPEERAAKAREMAKALPVGDIGTLARVAFRYEDAEGDDAGPKDGADGMPAPPTGPPSTA